eukprot:403365807
MSQANAYLALNIKFNTAYLSALSFCWCGLLLAQLGLLVQPKTLQNVKMRIHEIDNELIENARANVQEESFKRIETIRTLNEYGIYYMQRGIQSSEFKKIKTVQFKSIHDTIGFTRCSICLHDFELNKKVKQFPIQYQENLQNPSTRNNQVAGNEARHQLNGDEQRNFQHYTINIPNNQLLAPPMARMDLNAQINTPRPQQRINLSGQMQNLAEPLLQQP